MYGQGVTMTTDAAPGSAGPRHLTRTVGTPLWRQLLADLRARMDGGEFTGGFPGELALVDQYGVSRHTVREALRQLRTEGVLDVSRGRRARLTTPDTVIEQPAGIVY